MHIVFMLKELYHHNSINILYNKTFYLCKLLFSVGNSTLSKQFTIIAAII